MSDQSFYCPRCGNATLWVDANAAGVGSFCSEQCAQVYAGDQHPPEAGPDLQLVAENASGTYCKGQQGQAEPATLPLFD